MGMTAAPLGILDPSLEILACSFQPATSQLSAIGDSGTRTSNDGLFRVGAAPDGSTLPDQVHGVLFVISKGSFVMNCQSNAPSASNDTIIGLAFPRYVLKVMECTF
jgi:hypothetical protein